MLAVTDEPTRTQHDDCCNVDLSLLTIALSQNVECHHNFFKDPRTFRRLDLCEEIQVYCSHSISGFVRIPLTSAVHYTNSFPRLVI